MSNDDMEKYGIAVVCTLLAQLRPGEEIDIKTVADDFSHALEEYDHMIEQAQR